MAALSDVPTPSKATLASWDLAKRLRQPWEGRWQRLIDVGMPYRTPFNGPLDGNAGQNNATVYDETGMVAIQEFAGRLHGGILPDGVEWARIEGDGKLPDNVLAGIADVQTHLFLQMARCNASPEIYDAFQDLGGFGNGCIRVVSGNWAQPLKFQAFPLADCWITPGPDGSVGDIHVRHRVPAYVAAAQWPGAKIPEAAAKGTRTLAVIDSWIRDVNSPTERWMRQGHLEGKNLLYTEVETGQGSCCYVFGRWSKGAGELYGVGQGMQALPAMMVCNEAMRLILAHADMALSGMWQAEDDGVLNPWAVKLAPGAIIPIAPHSRGLMPLTLPTTRLDIGQLVLEEQRHAIKKALFNETLGAREGTPATAMEIRQRMQELARSIGPAYGRVWHEFALPLMHRIIRLMKAQGRIVLPDVDGRQVKITSASSMVRAAGAGQVQEVNEWMASVAQFFGPQALGSVIPVDRYARWSSERLNVPANLLYSADERAENQAKLVQGGAAALEAGVDPKALTPLLGSLGGMS